MALKFDWTEKMKKREYLKKMDEKRNSSHNKIKFDQNL